MRRLYWAKEGMKFIGTVLGASFLYSLFMTIMDGDGTLEKLVVTGTTYLAMFGSVMAMVFNMTAYQTFLPLTLSFGCTRREAIVGMQVYRLTVLVVLAGVSAVLTSLDAFTMSTAPRIIIALEISAYLFFSSLGGVSGALSTKLSKVMLGIVSAAAVLVGLGLVCGVAVYLVTQSMELPGGVGWILLALAVLIYGLCSIAEARTIKRFCVR